ncbi:MAG: 3-deoxy-manno-octulosonate cytidylyltransferase [Desulfarculaceae bacterium]|nr:3-deoxy-manno-octulosonate cytidylyltransferase [Desulfarculaceae bacterium]MCF8072100.1 3-deoxy-manno-octulosonate cytidylyltransferase [Desulfarculaceae bacterium]MCF8100021.1 3-deoxy-manno-octulosonate cytidylyltransferase [Desulfarculaceae bacterium]
MRIVAFIPARMAATRFPGKPLAMIAGLPMIEHVRRRAMMSELMDEVVVATCDQEIHDTVTKHGGKAVMTADTHVRCTDRIAEAGLNVEADVVVNLQGDEPLVMPEMLTKVAQPLIDDPELPAANLVSPILDDQEFNDPNAPKVVLNLAGDILYISREPIPSLKKADSTDFRKLKQLGIIAFRSDFLQTFTKLAPTPLEIVESVDMNRALEHGFRVKAVEVAGRMIGVDMPGDVARVEAQLANDPLFDQYR